MKLALISTYSTVHAVGMRQIAACLEAAGHHVRQVYLTCQRSDEEFKPIPAPALEQLAHLCADAEVVAFSLMANNFLRARQATSSLRNALEAPILWGGIHPTVCPEECLRDADYVCVGEGEEAVLDFCQRWTGGQDLSTVPNIWTRKDGRIIQNEVRPLIQDLDALPFPDYSCQDDHVLEGEDIVPLDTARLAAQLDRHMVMASRGCPYSCAYCCNFQLKALYKRKGRYLRFRSVDSVIAEIEASVARFPRTDAVQFVDDSFFSRSIEEMQRFAELYAGRIRRSITCQAHPDTVTEEKLAIMIRAGMTRLYIGIQSGSQRTCDEVFLRRTSLECVADALRLVNRHKGVLLPQYQYIINNPFETRDDRIATIRFAVEAHRPPFEFELFPLTLYPGTMLLERARTEGIEVDLEREVYNRSFAGKSKWMHMGWLTLLLAAIIRLQQWRLPRPLIRLCARAGTSRAALFLLDREPVLHLMAILRRAFKNAIYRPLISPIARLNYRRKYRRWRSPTIP